MGVLQTLLKRAGYIKDSSIITQKTALSSNFEKSSQKEALAINPLAMAFQQMNNSYGIRKSTMITMQTLRRMSRANWVDRTCIFTLRDEITGLKWDIVPTNPKAPYSETFRQYLIQLLKKPNSNRENWRSFIDKIVEDILVVDAGCIEKVRNGKGYISELYHVDGATIKPIYDERGIVSNPAYYQYLPGQKGNEPVAEFDNDDLIYIMWNPQGAVDTFGYGMSPVEAGLTVATAFLYAEMYNMQFFRTNTIPPVVINLGKDVPAGEVDKFRTFLASEIQGAQGYWTPIVGAFAEGFDIKELLKSPTEMAYKEYVTWQMRWKVALYRMSPQDIGFTLDQYKVEGEVQQQLSKNKAINSLKGVLKEFVDTEIIMDTGWDLSNANLEFAWIDDNPLDPQVQANVDKIYLDEGVYNINDVRARQGMELLKGGQIPMKVIGAQAIPIDPSPVEESENEGLRKSLQKSQEEYDYKSTQLDLPDDIAEKIKSFCKDIPDKFIYTNDDGLGREDNIHCTVLYGLSNKTTTNQIKSLCEDVSPIELKLGKVSMFENDEYDVLKIDVESESLNELNKKISDNVKAPGNDYPTYKPHITIAYMQKGTAGKYVGNDSFKGMTCSIDDLCFSNKKGEKTIIPLGTINVKKNFEERGLIVSMAGNQTAIAWMDDRGVTQPLFITDFGKNKGFLVKPDSLGERRGNESPVEEKASQYLRSLNVNTPEVRVMSYDEVLQLIPNSLKGDFTKWISLEPPYDSQFWRETWGDTRKNEKYIVTGFISGRDLNNESLNKDMQIQPESYKQAVSDFARLWLGERKYYLGDRKAGHYIVTTDGRGYGVDYTFFDDKDSWDKTNHKMPVRLQEINPVLYDMFKSDVMTHGDVIEKALKIRRRGDRKPMPQIQTLEKKFSIELQKRIYVWYKKAVHMPHLRRTPKRVVKANDFNANDVYVTDGQYIWQNNVKYPISVLDTADVPTAEDLQIPNASYRPFWDMGIDTAQIRLEPLTRQNITIHAPDLYAPQFDHRIDWLSNTLNETLRKDVNDTIVRGIDQGSTYNEIARDMEQTIGVNPNDPDMPLWRAEKIARTESQWALNEGMRQQYQEVGITQMNIVPAPDACDECLDAVKDNPYSVNQEDILPIHPNCRCDWAADQTDMLGEGDTGDTVDTADEGQNANFTPLITNPNLPEGYAETIMEAQKSKFKKADEGQWVTMPNGAHLLIGEDGKPVSGGGKGGGKGKTVGQIQQEHQSPALTKLENAGNTGDYKTLEKLQNENKGDTRFAIDKNQDYANYKAVNESNTNFFNTDKYSGLTPDQITGKVGDIYAKEGEVREFANDARWRVAYMSPNSVEYAAADPNLTTKYASSMKSGSKFDLPVAFKETVSSKPSIVFGNHRFGAAVYNGAPAVPVLLGFTKQAKYP